MTDQKGFKIKKGDWVLYNPLGFDNENLFRAGQISRIDSDCKAVIYQGNDPDPWYRHRNELLKITEKEAMLYLLIEP